eukprot:TRINITY_DN811_c0_g1_i1.p1 TRINITY_DN811_c0_g1~~TRINITY_DN811_c0_g1_i1.p1  ORF type:complete len:189 (+),score=43.94 TRINITY_DN811_c0_g1_i1:693-1259(+)
MNMEVPQEVSECIASFDASITKLEDTLKPFFAVELKELMSRLTPFEGAKLNIAMAYTLCSLFYMYLKTQGISPADHPVMEELQRVKSYIQKIKSISGEKQGPKMRVDVPAATRMIVHGTKSINIDKQQDTKVDKQDKQQEANPSKGNSKQDNKTKDGPRKSKKRKFEGNNSSNTQPKKKREKIKESSS